MLRALNLKFADLNVYQTLVHEALIEVVAKEKIESQKKNNKDRSPSKNDSPSAKSSMGNFKDNRRK